MCERVSVCVCECVCAFVCVCQYETSVRSSPSYMYYKNYTNPEHSRRNHPIACLTQQKAEQLGWLALRMIIATQICQKPLSYSLSQFYTSCRVLPLPNHLPSYVASYLTWLSISRSRTNSAKVDQKQTVLLCPYIVL